MPDAYAAPLVVSADACARAIGQLELIEEIALGFIAYSEGRVDVPPVGYLGFSDPPGDVHIKYGSVRDGAVFVIKIAGGFPQNALSDLPTADGCMMVFSSRTGFLQAILLDRARLTDIRTAAAGAVAARALAPSVVARIGILGTGMQSQLQAEFLKHVTGCRSIALWGRSQAHASARADALIAAGFDVELCASAEEVVAGSNLVVTTTAAREPLFRAEAVRAGTHITALGADAPGKQELDPTLFARADAVIVDSTTQCADHGDLAWALAAETYSLDRVHELGAALADKSLGRTSDEQITIADLTGVAVQDIVIATHVLRRVSAEATTAPAPKKGKKR